MVDAIEVLPPGWRALDVNGVPFTDGILAFFDAGTNNPKVVYSDATLTTSLGTTVVCNSSGTPVTSASVPTLIYLGSAPYKIRLTSAISGGTVFEFDNVKGALDSSIFLTAAFTPDVIVVADSAERNILAADKGKLINVNPTAVALSMSFAPATVLGDGFWVGIRHEGDANWVNLIAGNGTDLFSYAGGVAKSLTLTGRGQTMWIACDGVGFKVYAEVPALISNNVGVIRIVDRLSAPPGSPPAGGRYILTAAPSGLWSTFAEGDVAEFGFYGWFKYTPPADSGWIAYVQDEDANYQFRGSAWVGIARAPTVQRFLTPGAGTYTPNTGVAYIAVTMVGGGGGGAAQVTNAGANGIDTSFGSWTAVHGNGGALNGGAGGLGGTGGATGAGTLADRFDGQNGCIAANFNPTFGGLGGSSFFGGGGETHDRSTGGTAKANTGSGGAGAGLATTPMGGGGGAGEYVKFYVQSPTATSYAVGAGGAGGAAGTLAGGAGAAGIIIVTEFYG